ncbi:hypothetical protein PPL_09542 [Heterostelium album PN500]|uniref:Uncharacterized protein n=1 Tax=Heterostelium pallidum (strain ATCC 26659 / Pp 5 / PN500) TaxID=670386 RepID=D3BND1_HETP5|nr:hypothetical protein PPL_09542 [Heterostelium album PN500]EFA76791.1 hypothetical protein PPL_09542 [Heterostelium album PN500]|eukprot:XP_020428923.1 hypothetical protein PPL_09542 [Heterostelium album PN500]
MSLAMAAKPKTKTEEEADLLSPSSPLPTSTPLEKSSVVLEGPMYEPFNVITIENISSQDTDPYEKIKSTYYRYGITAGRQIYERFGKHLTVEQNKEICWMLGQNNLAQTLA